eukprot:4506529-Prymnesium_polylepis.1
MANASRVLGSRSPAQHVQHVHVRVSQESRCVAQELDCFKLPRYNGGDLKVSMSISQRGVLAGDTRTLSISSLDAHRTLCQELSLPGTSSHS